MRLDGIALEPLLLYVGPGCNLHWLTLIDLADFGYLVEDV